MNSIHRTLVVLVFAALAGCGETTDPPSSPGHSAKTANGLYEIAYTPNPDPIPFSELFELDVTVTDVAKKPVSGATLNLNVTMPAHGHGMQTSPEIASVGEGHFKISGMKFHMHGDWNLSFTVQSSAGTDTATFIESYE